MFLRICDSSFLFEISHTKYFDIVCYSIIILCVFLCLVVQNLRHKPLSQVSVIIASSIFLVFLILIYVIILNPSKFNGCSCPVNVENNTLDKITNDNTGGITQISRDKIIIIGDSRMWLIEFSKDELSIPNNINFIAAGGAKIDWLIYSALPKLHEDLQNKNPNYQYHVVVNLGVNDLNSIMAIKNKAGEYYTLYKKLAVTYPDVKFYLLSVNPIDEEIMTKIYGEQTRTNMTIIEFNNYIINGIKNQKMNNVKYCDSFNNIEFSVPDGIHFDNPTNQRIINYIINDCVEY